MEHSFGPGFLSRIATTVRDWRERARLQREFDGLAACGLLDRVLAESGLTRAELPTVLRSHPRAGWRHAAMRRWTGVDDAMLPPNSELREAQLSCIRCTASRACEHWLALPESKRPVPRFCPNLGTFRRIRAWQAGPARAFFD